jgi:hypothetical protein
MADSKIYLNVPFAQKDEAKALGARWDAANKKWYVPANKDLTLFAKWQAESPMLESTAAPPRRPNAATSTDNGSTGVFTHPTIKDFAPYNGDEPPWD